MEMSKEAGSFLPQTKVFCQVTVSVAFMLHCPPIQRVHLLKLLFGDTRRAEYNVRVLQAANGNPCAAQWHLV